ncbi:integral membrane protein S linking to the trans Golgi network-domain-containing protein [Pelagophyceae sp. CCMP2097]|nr:integral membrane protein S linking to the trans Golgi network-domain-containing protein [Pelagophyceae sp. CCMP2097]
MRITDRMKQNDAVLIVLQMISLQCLFYAGTGAMLATAHVLFGTSLSLDAIFSTCLKPRWAVTGSHVDVGVVLASGVVGAALLGSVVEKSRKCLDFSLTLYAVHATACLAYSSFNAPTGVWWITHICALIVMIVLGEYVCSRRELRDIPLVA